MTNADDEGNIPVIECFILIDDKVTWPKGLATLVLRYR